MVMEVPGQIVVEAGLIVQVVPARYEVKSGSESIKESELVVFVISFGDLQPVTAAIISLYSLLCAKRPDGIIKRMTSIIAFNGLIKSIFEMYKKSFVFIM